jgi:hypothetical protein
VRPNPPPLGIRGPVMGWESHVSVALALCVDESLDDSSVQFLVLAAHAHADIPLAPLALVTFFSLGLLVSSTGLLVDSMGLMGIITHKLSPSCVMIRVEVVRSHQPLLLS